MNSINELLKKIDALGYRAEKTTDIDKKLREKITYEQRKTTSHQLERAFTVLDILVNQRFTLHSIFIYASKKKQIRNYERGPEVTFPLTTTEWILTKIGTDFPTHIDDIFGSEARITEYNEFERRAILLLKAVGDGRLDNCHSKNIKEIIYEIMGRTGTLLEIIGVNPLNDPTESIFNNQIQDTRDFKNNKIPG